MNFGRRAEHFLNNWRDKPHRKPLILRGARQVGKSTLVNQFGKQFRYFVSLNLERPSDRRFFEKERDVKDVWQQILFESNLPDAPRDTLLFIDEIQEIPHVIKQLRYFYEDLPQLHVIAAGSLLEFALGDVKSFPVGRIEEYTLYPLDFQEFLRAIGEENAFRELQVIPFNTFAYDKLFALFNTYLIFGGMPEVIKTYVESNRSVTGLRDVYASIWGAYQSDIVKYAKNDTEAKVLRHLLVSAPFARDRIHFEHFGGSNYRSREVGEAFRALDLAKIIYLIYPTTQNSPPQVPDLTRKPRLQFLDTGLLNYASGIQPELLRLEDLSNYHRGFIVQHGATQELMATAPQHAPFKPLFWVKENASSTAEVDLTFRWGQYLLPVEVKSGAKGRLRSLNEFMDATSHDIAVRLLHNHYAIENSQTRNGKRFQLLNLPYFAVCQLEQHLDWMSQNGLVLMSS